jgi:6-phosphogluconolactonase
MGGNGFSYKLVRGEPEEVILKLAELILEIADECVGTRGLFKCALAGGTTPAPLYRILSERFVHWENTIFFPTDERFVPQEDPRSNYRMIRENLGESARIRRINTELTPETACMDFANALSDFGSPDFALLGIGEDGHTASLFPGRECRKCGESACITEGPDGLLRISMSYSALISSRIIAFLVLGEKKEQALRRVLKGDLSLPAARIRGRKQTFIFTDLPL